MAYDQSSFLSIRLMVVDDDPVFLQVMSRMLEKSRFRDPSITELTVVAAKDSMDALSTLKIQRNNIDLIVTDYYMPGMNGLQLKSEITRKFGNLPVIVMSADANKEKESISCGALCFLPKPIKAMDLTKIYEVAITCKRNGKSILLTEHKDNKDTTCHVITSHVPKQIRLIPHEQVNDMKTKNKKLFSRSDSRSMNSSTIESCVIISTDGSRKNQERIKLNGGSCGNVGSLSRRTKKNKITWTDFLHDRFLQAIRHLGLDKAVPKKILEFMNVSYLTRENVASHLQKYRIFLRKVAEKGMNHSTSWSDTSDLTEMYNYFKNSNSWYDTTTLNDRSFYSRAIQNGFGQSRLLSNTREPFCFNQKRSPNYYNYMTNRSSNYDEPRHLGSALTLPPFTSNINFSNQTSQNELGRQSFLEPQAMANKTNQTSNIKLVDFGHHGSSASTNVSSFNSDMVMDYGLSNYGSSILNQQGLNYYGRLTPNQPELGNYEIATPNQSNNGRLTSNQGGLSNNGSLTLNQPGLSNNGSLIIHNQGLSNHESSTINQQGLRNNESLTLNQLGLSNNGSLTLNRLGLSNNGSLTLNPIGLSNNGSLTPNPIGLSNNGSLTLNPIGLSNNGSLTPNQIGLSNNGSLTPKQPRFNNVRSPTSQSGLSSYGSSAPNQFGLSNYGSSTIINQQDLNDNYGSLTHPNQAGPSNFSYGMQSTLLNNENNACQPQGYGNAATQPNVEISELENFNLFGDFDNTNELPWYTSYFQVDQNKQQGEAAPTTEFELPANFSELNQIFSLEGDVDWTFMNTNQDNGETSNTFAAQEMDSTNFNVSFNHNQGQDVSDLIDWSLLEPQVNNDIDNDLVDEDFMDSLFNNDMY